jgi:putative transposase
VSWPKFRDLLEFKARWYGRTLSVIGKSYPFNQICSVCGTRNALVKNLNIREWACNLCHTHLDRNINAAMTLNKKDFVCWQAKVLSAGISSLQ